MSLSYGSAIGYDMLEIPSNPSISSSSNFNGDITFQIDQPSEQCYIVGKQSYLSLQLQITMSREEGTAGLMMPIVNGGNRLQPTALSVPYICPNPAGALFQNVTCYVKGTQISNFQYAQHTNTLYRMLYESEEEQATTNSTNPIIPMTLTDRGVTAGILYPNYVNLANIVSSPNTATDANYINQFSNHMIWALKNQMNFNNCATNRINFQLPCPLFFSDELLHFGDSYAKIVLNVDPAWATNLICIAGSPNVNTTAIAGAVGPPVVTAVVGSGGEKTYSVVIGSVNALGATQTPFTFNVQVVDFRLYLCRAWVTSSYVPRSLSQTIYLKQFSSFKQQLQSSSNTITAPLEPTRRVTHICVGFVNGSSGGISAFHYSPTDISSGFTTATGAYVETLNTQDAQTNLVLLNVTYAGITYPQASYNLTSSAFINYDLSKAFSDYTVFSDSVRDRNGSLMSFSQWQAQPLYVFKMRQGLNNQNSNCYINVNMSTTPVNCSIVVLALYDEWLTITYDEFVRITEVRKDASPPLSA